MRHNPEEGGQESSAAHDTPGPRCIHRIGKNTEYCACTHVGLKRRKNDDFFLAVTGNETNSINRPVTALGSVFAVADGMGGHPAGDVAAHIACNSFMESYYGVSMPKRWAYRLAGAIIPPLACRFMMERMERAVSVADMEIGRYEHDHPEADGLGTTLSVLVVQGRLAMISHVGDSRIYLVRNGQLELLTTDHTFVQDLVDMGDMTKSAASRSPMRHVLMQALGQGFEGIQSWCGMVREGDMFLVCSDGLHDMVDPKLIEEALRHDTAIDVMCRKLVDMALEAGGKDNVTMILTRPVVSKRLI